MHLGAEWYIFLLEVVWPLAVFIIGAIAMHRSGMLPQQQRLEGLLKDTIAAQTEQLELRILRERTLEDRLRGMEEDARTRTREYDEHLAQKSLALDALQLALAREQAESARLRSLVADNQLKLSALIELTKKKDEVNV